MELHTLSLAIGSRKTSKRKGRGQGSGKGGTSTKGHKGAQSRSGYKTRPHSEGGQMPLQRRVPKVGFKRPNKIRRQPIILTQLALLAEKAKTIEITDALIRKHQLVKKGEPYKILNGKGDFTKKLNGSAAFFSLAAQEAIKKQGGTVTIINEK